MELFTKCCSCGKKCNADIKHVRSAMRITEMELHMSNVQNVDGHLKILAYMVCVIYVTRRC